MLDEETHQQEHDPKLFCFNKMGPFCCSERVSEEEKYSKCFTYFTYTHTHTHTRCCYRRTTPCRSLLLLLPGPTFIHFPLHSTEPMSFMYKQSHNHKILSLMVSELRDRFGCYCGSVSELKTMTFLFKVSSGVRATRNSGRSETISLLSGISST